ncbi:MAG: DUF2380 domain-containing protein [Methylobacter sp.]|uniref:DUF2380 domain-containing protein n=1 Tax=Candidatus Methylobacter titanis TaxID=3053457 RepID=A0AA43Q5I1_9GAMM|nr:DUF2380 domain-containing protein [Candidatus Methylobacter titanis]MDI1293483.1 DUF2380 domain-containing protein [Candidatus Methylobacter titanis]
MKLIGLILLVYLAFSDPVNADPRIAVLNFELLDDTLLPNLPKELTHTAAMKPLLEQAISQLGDYEIVQISLNDQNAATAGKGYLFNFNDVAAKLGKQSGTDWVVVGQHSKHSFLYSYLMAHLVDVKTQNLAGDFPIELKGTDPKVTQRGINALAKKLTARIMLLTDSSPKTTP